MDLPEPLAPTTATNSPADDGEVEPRERVDGRAGIAVAEVADLEQRLGARAAADGSPVAWTSRRREAS